MYFWFDMVTISVNGEITQLPQPCSLSEIVRNYNSNDLQVAVAVNGEFVPRSNYSTTQVVEGDLIDVVSPVGGG